jgi:hypothetical protein
MNKIMNSNNTSDNVFFLLEEKNTNDTNNMNNTNRENYMEYENEYEFKYKELMDELNNVDSGNENTHNLMYLLDKEFYGNDEMYYNHECNVKELLKICRYYGIDKTIKSAKCKKQDIIATIVYFENQPENFEIVKKRNLMWAYIIELMNDQKMKKYIIWN